MAYLVMERTYETPLSDADQEQHHRRAAPCLERFGVRWVESFLSSTRRRKICIFEAADAEAVRIAFRMAGIPFERVWPAERLAPEDATASAGQSFVQETG